LVLVLKNSKKKSRQLNKAGNAPIALSEFDLQAAAANEGTHQSLPPRHSAGTSEHKSFAAEST